MAASLRRIAFDPRIFRKLPAMSYSADPSQLGGLGSGAGKGGGGGGSIRDAGGSFGKLEAGREEEYFYKLQKEQLKTLHAHMAEEIAEKEAEIKRHEEAIESHKESIKRYKERIKKIDD